MSQNKKPLLRKFLSLGIAVLVVCIVFTVSTVNQENTVENQEVEIKKLEKLIEEQKKVHQQETAFLKEKNKEDSIETLQLIKQKKRDSLTTVRTIKGLIKELEKLKEDQLDSILYAEYYKTLKEYGLNR